MKLLVSKNLNMKNEKLPSARVSPTEKVECTVFVHLDLTVECFNFGTPFLNSVEEMNYHGLLVGAVLLAS